MNPTNSELAAQIESFRELFDTKLNAHQELMLEKLKPLGDLQIAVRRNTRQINIWRGVGSAVTFILGGAITLIAAALHAMRPVVK